MIMMELMAEMMLTLLLLVQEAAVELYQHDE